MHPGNEARFLFGESPLIRDAFCLRPEFKIPKDECPPVAVSEVTERYGDENGDWWGTAIRHPVTDACFALEEAPEDAASQELVLQKNDPYGDRESASEKPECNQCEDAILLIQGRVSLKILPSE